MRYKHYNLLLILFLFATQIVAQSNNFDYVTAEPLKGEGIGSILLRHGLLSSNANIDEFKSLNSTKISKRGNLVLGENYELPIKIVKFNGQSIRTTLGITDIEYAKKVQDYNERMFKKKVRKSDYKRDKKLWVPIYDFLDQAQVITEVKKEKEKEEKDEKSGKTKDNKKDKLEPLFGDKYSKIRQVSNKLKGRTYYLDAGHGGPDPGAQSERDGKTLSEDEYAYDVTLRLAKNIMENCGNVYLIVQDPSDGIRDDAYLNNSRNELYLGAEEIPVNHLQRLRVRAEIVNNLYSENEFANKHHHLICIHVDSRVQKHHQIDIFYYYKSISKEGKSWAETLLKTIENKYAKAQPNRGYTGSVSSRDELYMIRKTLPTTTYIELGNIQNQRDQIRIMEPNNRQAMANWLLEGLINIATNDKKSR